MENEKKATLQPVPRDATATNAAPVVAPPELEPPRNKRRPYIIVFAIIGVMLVSIAGYLIMTAGEQDTDDAQVMADMVPIGTRVSGQVCGASGSSSSGPFGSSG